MNEVLRTRRASHDEPAGEQVPALSRSTLMEADVRGGRRWYRPLASDWAIRVITAVLVFAAWWLIGEASNTLVFASPAETVAAFRQQLASGELVRAWTESLGVLFVGLSISAVLGISIGVLFGRFRAPYELFSPLFAALMMTPGIALLPLISLWLGYGDVPKVIVVVLFSFFNIYYTMLGGVRTIDAEYVEVSRSYSITGWAMIRKIVLPGALPYVITSLRLGLLHGMVGVVLGGFFLESTGIGGLISNAASSFRMPLVFSTLITVAAVGILINEGLQYVERRLAPWKARDFA